jgi:hypothetical protein
VQVFRVPASVLLPAQLSEAALGCAQASVQGSAGSSSGSNSDRKLNVACRFVHCHIHAGPVMAPLLISDVTMHVCNRMLLCSVK